MNNNIKRKKTISCRDVVFREFVCCLPAVVTSALNIRTRQRASGVVAMRMHCGNLIPSRHATVSADTLVPTHYTTTCYYRAAFCNATT